MMQREPNRLTTIVRVRWFLGMLLVTGAGLFAVGVRSEGRSHGHAERSAGAGEAGEVGETGEASEGSRPAEAHERVLGLDLESGPVAVAAVVASVGLAAATWRRDRARVLIVTAVFAGVFALLDVVELSHQVERSATTLAAIAGAVAVLHVGAAFVADRRRACAT